MPELAEVEFNRKQWNSGLRQKIMSVELHAKKRVFRGTDTGALKMVLTGANLLESHTHGKQMLFRFSKNAWLGVHLGMTGSLRTEKVSSTPAAKHDHLVLHQAKQNLIFCDPRQFGRILFHVGEKEPLWWQKLPPGLLEPEFTRAAVETFLHRHRGMPIKAVLLLQDGFPGIGNWMADEILWRAKIPPQTLAGQVGSDAASVLWKEVRFVCKHSMRIIGEDYSDPPKSWLFLHRWEKGGDCPRCGTGLKHATIGGRTTCWCPKCQT
jgi:formamidopyrimidine-DNA glycosylase